jgi:hypothetical protein
MYLAETWDSLIDAIGKPGKTRIWALNRVTDLPCFYIVEMKLRIRQNVPASS